MTIARIAAGIYAWQQEGCFEEPGKRATPCCWPKPLTMPTRSCRGRPQRRAASISAWQAVIEVGRFIESDPEPVWQFVRQWGNCPQEDVAAAIACCLLEHLLEHHFDLIFPRVEKAAKEDPLFACTLSRCWTFD